MLSRRIWDPPVDSDYDHLMIHKLADLLGYRSLTMLLSISLTRLPDMSAKERVMAWADNVIIGKTLEDITYPSLPIAAPEKEKILKIGIHNGRGSRGDYFFRT